VAARRRARSRHERRTLQRSFQRGIGLTPAEYRRVARLRRLLVRLETSGVSLADAAAAAGYYDQPHLAREGVEIMYQSVASVAKDDPAILRGSPHLRTVLFFETDDLDDLGKRLAGVKPLFERRQTFYGSEEISRPRSGRDRRGIRPVFKALRSDPQ
jgi:hypothetical protein